jgi:hypothetical protein
MVVGGWKFLGVDDDASKFLRHGSLSQQWLKAGRRVGCAMACAQPSL